MSEIDIDGKRIKCGGCGYVWNYRGARRAYVGEALWDKELLTVRRRVILNSVLTCTSCKRPHLFTWMIDDEYDGDMPEQGARFVLRYDDPEPFDYDKIAQEVEGDVKYMEFEFV